MLIAITLLISQPPSVPIPPPSVPIRSAQFKHYTEMSLKGVLITFIDTTPRVVKGLAVCRTESLPGFTRSIVVSRDGWWVATLPATATDAEIRQAAGLEKMAIPFADASDVWPVGLLDDMEQYASTKVTQQSFNRSGNGAHQWVSRTTLDAKWNVPGGLVGITGWTSTLYRGRSNKVKVSYDRWEPKTWVNDDGSIWGSEFVYKRTYATAVFADVLRYSGKVFEVRIAEKHDGQWQRYIAYKNRAARPLGYHPLRSSDCASCHQQAGSGVYAGARVPGGDTIISESF